VVEFRPKKDEKDDPKLCSVKGCENPFKRKMSGKAVTKAISDIQWKTKDPRKVRLCKDHYKDYKKATKEDRKLDRMSWER
jgi:hypothetical protein